MGRARASSHAFFGHFWPFFWSFFGPFFGPFFGHFWDAFPNYTPFSNMQIMVLLWFLGSQLWTYFWATFGPFSDAKSPLKTGYYGYRKWAPKNGRDWAEKTTLNGSKKNVTFQKLSPGKKKLSPGKSWKTGMGRGSPAPQPNYIQDPRKRDMKKHSLSFTHSLIHSYMLWFIHTLSFIHSPIHSFSN